MIDCLTDLKDRFHGYMDGQYTFDELKHAVNKAKLNCSDTDVIDYLSKAHRNGLLGNDHYSMLIDDISIITRQKPVSNPDHAASVSVSGNSPKELTVLNNRFVLGPIIGKGGMGVVYKARDLRKMEVNDKDDVVAIKVLTSELQDLPKYLIALQREAKKAQKLAHPNIVTVYDFDRDGEIAYMTMEYLDGVSLSKIIQARAPLPRKDAIRIIRNIARGLSYAHKHKIAHSDLKPSNIFLLKNGAVKILDFGIARAFHQHEEKTGNTNFIDTQAFNAFTPAYASCEIIESIPPTPKDDIYALGCIAHELLTASHPYDRVAADKAREEQLTVKRNKYLAHHEYRAICHAVELDKDKRVNAVHDFMLELTRAKPKSLLLRHPSKTSILALAALVAGAGLYTVIKIREYESITAQQAIIVNKFEIEKNLFEADNYLNTNDYSMQEKNHALTLYQRVLELDPHNPRAKSGIRTIKEKYIQHIEIAIKSNNPTRVSELINALKTNFPDDIELQHYKNSLNQLITANQVSLLLKKAAKEEADSLYVGPENANAYYTYHEILKLAPGDPRALQGLDRIREYLISKAERMIQDSEWKKAEKLIKDALLISPGNKKTVELWNKIKTQRLSDNTLHIKNNNTFPSANPVNAGTNNEQDNREDKAQPAAEKLRPSQQRLIKLHTDRANIFISQAHHYGPDNNNAAYHFKRILLIDSSNEHARDGLHAAWLKLNDSVNRHIESNNYSAAIDQLEKSKHHFSPFYDAVALVNEITNKRDQHPAKNNRHNEAALRLTQAKIQIKADHWIAPKGNNAMESYLEVQKINPNNEEAKAGLKKVENKFSLSIRAYIDSGHFPKAESMLKQALDIFPHSNKLNNLKRLLRKSYKTAKQNSAKPDLSKQIAELLKNAENALIRKRYIFPTERSAYDLYSKIISLEPANTIGVRGLNEAKYRAYAQIESDIRNNNHHIAYLGIHRLSKLGVTDKRFNALQTKLANADPSYKESLLKFDNQDNYLLYLLMIARQQESKGVIWPPLNDNAYNIYRHVNDIEPLNNTARQALAGLFRKRMSHIKDLLEKKYLIDAERELLALDKLYESKKEKEIISLTLSELDALKTIDFQL